MPNLRSEVTRDSVVLMFDVNSKQARITNSNRHMIKADFFQMPQASLPTNTNRIHPVWFGVPVRTDLAITWIIPEGWSHEHKPIAFESSCTAGSLNFLLSADSSTARVLATLEITGKLIEPEAYETALKFSKDIAKKNNLFLTFKSP